MKRKEFAELVAKICEEAETDMSLVVSGCRRAEVVDVRHIAIRVLAERGYYACDIAEYMGMSERNVRRVLCGFDDRVRGCKAMRYVWERVKYVL